MKKEIKPILDEGVRNIILSRLFGENCYTTNPNMSDMRYIGYFGVIALQVYFWQHMASIDILTKVSKKESIGINKEILEKVLYNEDMTGETYEEVDFSNDLFVSVITSKKGISLFFDYKNNRA